MMIMAELQCMKNNSDVKVVPVPRPNSTDCPDWPFVHQKRSHLGGWLLLNVSSDKHVEEY